MNKKRWIGAAVIVLVVASLPTLFSIYPLSQIWISRLEKKYGGEIEVGSASFRWFGPQQIEQLRYHSPGLAVSCNLSSPLPFWQIGRFSDRFEIQDGKIDAGGGVALEQISGMVDPAKTSIHGTSKEGGIFQISQVGEVIEINLKKAPTILFDRLLQTNGLLPLAIGSTLDLNGKMERPRIELNLHAPNGACKLTGTLSKDSLTLTSPLLASFQVTPGLTQRLNLPPATGSISCNISPDGFEWPLKMDLAKIRILKGQLVPSAFQISSGPSLESVGSLLKNSSMFRRPYLEVRSTPIDFSLQKGDLSLERFDFLLNRSVHFCLWGQVDIISQNLRLNLGISAQTLMSLLGIQGLQSSAVLRIPVRGTIQEPKLDTQSATTKIAALTASQIVPQKGILKLLPKVLDTALDDQKEIPPQRYPLQ